MTPQEQARLAKARPVGPEVLDAYLKGRYAWNKGSVEAVHQAVASFQEAIAKDSGYAAAYAGLADCYVQLGSPCRRNSLHWEPRHLPRHQA